jgi:hypothetical protein
VIEKESRLDLVLDAAFRSFRRLPEAVQWLSIIAVPGVLVSIAYLVSRTPGGVGWAFFVVAMAYLATVYLTLMWAAGAMLDGDSFRLIGLQRDKKDLRNLHWTQFERLTSALFEAEGYEVARGGGPRRDGGVDARITKDGKTWLVQCKHWPNETFFVKVELVRELLGVVAKEGAAGGLLVTSGLFGEPAREFAVGTPMELVDGDQLWARLARAQVAVQPDGSVDAPRCAFCNSLMALREGAYGFVLIPAAGPPSPSAKRVG